VTVSSIMPASDSAARPPHSRTASDRNRIMRSPAPV
jgi:hypothetical protein